ncbi:hypothetical protein QUA43_28765 [Microcoleus sp. N9_B4]|uniref:hypothetical protein n=1 Tax=Microcoleus sp. N9_B4 TaxID=3055386 RepID=UPI002FD034C3
MSEIQKIQHEVPKNFLLKAKDFMEKEDYPNTILYATCGLEIMFSIAKRGNPKDLQNLESLDEITICSYLGISIKSYVRYRKMAGYAKATAAGINAVDSSGLFSQKIFKANFDKKDSEVSLNYCTKTIIEIQEALEELNKPLSRE